MNPERLQRHRILQFAAFRGSEGFTRADAAYYVGCYELASRIGELEARGATFKRERETGLNMFGDPVRFMRYRLTSAPRNLIADANLDPAEFTAFTGDDVARLEV